MPTAIGGYGYLSIMCAGLLFSAGFTTPFAIIILVEMAPTVNPLIAAPLAGCMALVADMTILEYARFSLTDELHHLKGTRFIRWIYIHFHRYNVPEKIRMYVLWSVAGLVIASPLPDELGVTLLGSATTIREKPFAIFCFALNTLGIFVILLSAGSTL
jgi:hypothetical protein